LESYSLVRGVWTIKEALRVSPFLFCGYYVHVLASEDGGPGQATVCFDLPRGLTRVRFFTGKWLAALDFQVAEKLKLASFVMQLGVAPVGLEKAFDALREYALAGLKTLQADLVVKNSLLASALQASEQAQMENAPQTVAALIRILETREEVEMLWLKPRGAREALHAAQAQFPSTSRRGAVALPADRREPDPVSRSQDGRQPSFVMARQAAAAQRAAATRAALAGEDKVSRRERRRDLETRWANREEDMWGLDLGEEDPDWSYAL